MTDCTHNGNHRLWVRVFVALVAAAFLGLVAHTGSARADGDPASDVLATQPLFLPQDAGLPLGQQGQLTGLLQAAARSGYEIRVAVVAARGDLGSVTELWRQPETYARFLGQELSLVYQGPLLVVMPDGFGLSGPGAAAGQSALAGVRIAPQAGAGLGAAVLTAVQRLAAASGHPAPVPPPSATAAGARSSDTISLTVFVLGAVLIAVAWGASLRARPPRRPRLRRRKPAGI
jgi:hypothetical protein